MTDEPEPIPKDLTRDSEYTTRTDRHRTVVGDEVSHLWAHGRQQYAINRSGGNLYFSGATIYSYGRHFPIARRVTRNARGGRSFVLFTTRDYSSTTRGHLSETRRAIPPEVEVHRVFNPLADAEHAHADNLNAIRGEIERLLTDSRKARGRAAGLIRQALDRAREGNDYARAVGLRKRISIDTPELRAELAAAEVAEQKHDAAVERMRARADERDRERRKRREAELAVEMAEWEQKLAAWKDGIGQSFPTRPVYSSVIHLRLKGSRIQTSAGVVVPLTAVLPLLPAIRGETSTLPQNVAGYGSPRLNHDTRVLSVGCHSIGFDEIERLATSLNIRSEAAGLPSPILADYLEERGHVETAAELRSEPVTI